MRQIPNRIRRATGLILFVAPVFGVVHLSRAQSNIDPVDKWSWSENAGWTNWYDDGVASGAEIEPSGDVFSGFIWAENLGWLYLGDGVPDFGPFYSNAIAADTGVNIGVGGLLSGFAWGENIGWVNFDTLAAAGPALAAQVDLCCPGFQFSGFAWGENVGWINLDSGVTFVGLGPGVSLDRGDLNNDGIRDGMDIMPFIDVFLSPSAAPFWEFCASDMDDDGDVDLVDVAMFTDCLLTGACICP
jgi:hypothetical protein